ncbi:hypothetical protein TcWFU_000499 [Taenia crassiceps]|uniref:Uncharacterized protein n=1 Tax=Taenia crassiceps TaxID=6207 RepID=A0ABR4QNR2_9CEST
MRASQVNRAWNRATHHPRLFHRLCCSPEWSLPNLDADFPPPLECRNANFFFPNLLAPTTDTTAANNEPSDAVDWFQKFKWRYQVRKNWEQGRHRIRRFVGHTGDLRERMDDNRMFYSPPAAPTIIINFYFLSRSLAGNKVQL